MALLVIGGTGFLGQAICRNALHRGLTVAALSRSGRPSQVPDWAKEIEYIKGDSLDPDSYTSILNDVDAVVHSVGTLLDNKCFFKSGYEGSHEHLNRDTALTVAKQMLEKDKNFVFISADRGIPLVPTYISTKREVEDFLSQNREKLRSAVVRPGFMYDDDDMFRKALSFPIGLASLKNDILGALGQHELKKCLAPAKPLHVDTVASATVSVALNDELMDKIYDVEDIEKVCVSYV